MKFSSRVELNAPAQAVFDQLADFTAFDRAARKRSISVRRTDALASPGAGMTWQIEFRFRGRMRQMETRLVDYVRPDTLDYVGETSGFELLLGLQTVALARERTRLNVTLEAKPRSLGARLLLQSAKLGKSALDRRFDDRVKRMGELLEAKITVQG